MRILWKSVTLFRLGRIPVQMHTSCAYFPGALILWIGWSDEGMAGVLDGLIYLVMLYFSLLVHEFAHVITGTWFGYRTRRVLLFPLGALAEMDLLAADVDEFVVALAGPLASALLGGLALVAYLAGGATMATLRFIPDNLSLFVLMNFFMALFNLLPVFPMDGGRILRSGLAFVLCLALPRLAHRSFLLATRIATRYVGWPTALGIVLLTIFRTHLWGHLVLFSLLPLVGEAEYWLLRESPQFKGNGELAFLPAPRGRRRFPHRSARGYRLILNPYPLSDPLQLERRKNLAGSFAALDLLAAVRRVHRRAAIATQCQRPTGSRDAFSGVLPLPTAQEPMPLEVERCTLNVMVNTERSTTNPQRSTFGSSWEAFCCVSHLHTAQEPERSKRATINH